MPDNPFNIGVLAEGQGFADREREVARIAAAFTSPGDKLVVYGDRRLGKSSALERAAAEIRRNGGRVAVASLATASDAGEAAQRVLSAAREATGSWWRDMADAIARRLRVGLEFVPPRDPDGMPTLRFRLGVGESPEARDLLPDVLTALNEELQRRDMVLGLGLDEFQRIHEWGGENAEWSFREAIQRHTRIAYVLAGSKRHLIEAMVSGKGRALWKLADVLPFGPIAPDVLADWIRERAASTGLSIPEPQAGRIVRLAAPRTRDIVQLARAVWARGSPHGTVMPGDPEAAMEAIVEEQAELYRAIFVKLTDRQQAVLRVIAAEPDVQITAAATLQAYGLGPKSSVQSAVEALVADEHLTGLREGGYGFDEPFFRRWVEIHALPDIGIQPPPLGRRIGD